MNCEFICLRPDINYRLLQLDRNYRPANSMLAFDSAIRFPPPTPLHLSSRCVFASEVTTVSVETHAQKLPPICELIATTRRSHPSISLRFCIRDDTGLTVGPHLKATSNHTAGGLQVKAGCVGEICGSPISINHPYAEIVQHRPITAGNDD